MPLHFQVTLLDGVTGDRSMDWRLYPASRTTKQSTTEDRVQWLCFRSSVFFPKWEHCSTRHLHRRNAHLSFSRGSIIEFTRSSRMYKALLMLSLFIVVQDTYYYPSPLPISATIQTFIVSVSTVLTAFALKRLTGWLQAIRSIEYVPATGPKKLCLTSF